MLVKRMDSEARGPRTYLGAGIGYIDFDWTGAVGLVL